MPTLVITGANRGIGLEFARQYAADGWRVIATARDPAAAEELRAVAEVHALDLADAAAIHAFACGLGDLPVDLLINNAGVMGPRFPDQSKSRIDVEGWVHTMRVNALAPLLLALALQDNLARAPRPTVATLTSQMGSIADNQSGGMYAYRASKAAVNMANRSLSVDLRDRHIVCVVLHPGWVQTEMGGPQAPLPTTDSVAGMRRVIGGLTLEHSGCFFAYDGREIAW